ncbi:sulfotransferase 6B1-like isoform X2 [Denticeps clupeoides]|uniref:sulfotransferase 6B1-like isoform X2 n=1 Tax=Denticeps clupeoides TaxID=299321 RepID=UPI0010A4E16A|nr:sulfotransferase 6B1-like isoform X2 [Denticeps clupeoides]
MSLSAAQHGGCPTWRQSKMELARTMRDEEKLYRHAGVLYPSVLCPAENLEALKATEARSEDILLMSFPKCGFNWMVAVLRKIMKSVSGKAFPPDTPPQMEFSSPDMQRMLAQEPSPRLIGTHLHPDKIPQSFKEKKTKTLILIRNPKDTAVSFYHFMENNPALPKTESWDKFFSDFVTVPFGSYFDHATACEKIIHEPNTMVITYEELKEDLTGSIRQISQFSGLPLTEDEVQTIAAESTFRAMLTVSKDTHSSFGSVLFRKGEVGDWKNLFTKAQSRQMDEEFTRRLGGTRLGAKLKYDVYCR